MNLAAQNLERTGVEEVGRLSGYESSSGFRAAFGKLFGKAPSKTPAADAIAMTWMESPVGPLVLGACDLGLTFLEFSEPKRLSDQLEVIRKQFGRPLVPGSHPILETAQKELADYFAGRTRDFSVPLHMDGTDFQLAVWNGLLTIPYGETESYEGLSKKIRQPGKQRAVGRANGQNRIAIIVPCHRVVNKSGALGGYGGGLWRKQILLDLERNAVG